jgi:hypothetical protein
MELCPLKVHFCTFGPERIPDFRVMALAVGWEITGKATVIGRWYFLRQAATALEFAQSTNDPELAAALVEKAADLLSRIDDPSARPDPGARAPDIEPPPAA